MSVSLKRFLVSFLILSSSVVTERAVATSTTPVYVGDQRAPRGAPRARLNAYQRRALDNYLAGATAAIDTLRILAIQSQFADTLMGGQPGSLRNEVRDSTYFANELRHVEQYFDGASRGRLTIVWEVTPRLYNLPEDMGYYGNDALQDTRVVEMMQSLIDSADGDIDFSRFDTFMILHAGAGQETDILDNSRDQIFSTFMDQADIDDAFPDSTVVGLATGDSLLGEPFLIDNFMVLPAYSSQDDITISTLGVYVFEVGSRLGLLPLFDNSPAGFPDSRGIGEYDLMSYGLFNAQGFVPAFPSAFNRVIAGWVDPVLVETDTPFRLADINSAAAGDTNLIRIPVSESEYFLVANRVHDTNLDSLFTFGDLDSNLIPNNTDSLGGAEFDFFLTDITNPFIVRPDPNYGGRPRRFVIVGQGIYIWHVDETVIRQLVDMGTLPNNYVSRKGVDLEEADGIQDLDVAGGAFSFSGHFDSYRAGNNTEFGPGTKPDSRSNSGVRTGITVKNVSAAGTYMTGEIAFDKPYDEKRARWSGSGPFQPPTVVDIDLAGGPEIVAFTDSGGVYVFNGDGSEFVDKDGDPATIEPYFSVPGATWIGPPAFGNIDGGADTEIIAASADGYLYAWNGDSTEVVDGDSNPATRGVLYAGSKMAAPPMLVDVTGNSLYEIVVLESIGDSLEASLVNSSGSKFDPSDPILQPVWPAKIAGHYAAPMAFGLGGQPGDNVEGVFVVSADTLAGTYALTFLGVRAQGAATGPATYQVTIPATDGVRASFPVASSPVVADLDGNGADEVVLTLGDGRLVIYNRSLSTSDRLRLIDLRSGIPSAPAVGDVDGNGTMEIAAWDAEYMYLYAYNGAVVTNWPQRFRATQLGDLPPLVFDYPLSGPLMGDIDGDGRVDILYPTPEGTVRALGGGGIELSAWPRVIPSGAGATGPIASLGGGGELSLVTLGFIPFLQTFESVFDTIVFDNTMVLSIQSLPGSDAQDDSFWMMYQHDPQRSGRVTESNPLGSAASVAEPNSFIVYPNPVKGTGVHARIVLNTSATVRVEIYNLEGQEAISAQFNANPGNVLQIPFDEVIDITRLESGVYLLRLNIESAGGSESFVKTFAILR